VANIQMEAWHARAQGKYVGMHPYNGMRWTTWTHDRKQYEGIVMFGDAIPHLERGHHIETRIPEADLPEINRLWEYAVEQRQQQLDAKKAEQQRQLVEVAGRLTRALRAYHSAGGGYELGALCMQAETLLSHFATAPEAEEAETQEAQE
jgi:hypothetical protein